MERTERLFDGAPYDTRFTARVLACDVGKDGFEVVLDRTLFFPEEGGQSADTGALGGVSVTQVIERDGVIRHTLSSPLAVGGTVEGEIDFAPRYRRMQNHTGEHILSSLVHARHGLHNVGFHLGSQDVTADFDGELDAAALRAIEDRANEIVAECHTVRGYYPTRDALAAMEYRSKIALDGDVRIVEIEGVDLCACCAPHVANTGEIGMIKILGHERYKGGVRVHLVCGYDALDAYRADLAQVDRISASLSVRHSEAALGVERLQGENERLRAELSRVKHELLDLKIEKIVPTKGNLCLFESDGDMGALRHLANAARERCGGICAAFSGTDAAGYKYIITANGVDLRAISGEINAAISGRGGGSAEMIQGSCTATRAQIEAYFSR